MIEHFSEGGNYVYNIRAWEVGTVKEIATTSPRIEFTTRGLVHPTPGLVKHNLRTLRGNAIRHVSTRLGKLRDAGVSQVHASSCGHKSEVRSSSAVHQQYITKKNQKIMQTFCHIKNSPYFCTVFQKKREPRLKAMLKRKPSNWL